MQCSGRSSLSPSPSTSCSASGLVAFRSPVRGGSLQPASRPSKERGPMRDRLLRWRWELFLSAILVAVFLVNISLSPFYLGEQNFVNMFQLSIEKLIVVVVMTFVIINGEIDLSVASVMAFSACVLAGLHDAGGVPFEAAVVIAILHRTAFGRSVYVIGNNANVARYSGINVARDKLIILTASGTAAGIAGVLL